MDIGVEGFEPPTYCSQSSRASQAALYSDFHRNKEITIFSIFDQSKI
jgi:hypothetical protein